MSGSGYETIQISINLSILSLLCSTKFWLFLLMFNNVAIPFQSRLMFALHKDGKIIFEFKDADRISLRIKFKLSAVQHISLWLLAGSAWIKQLKELLWSRCHRCLNSTCFTQKQKWDTGWTTQRKHDDLFVLITTHVYYTHLSERLYDLVLFTIKFIESHCSLFY